MGYWAKDGAYVHDDNDTKAMEAMNETQGQRFDRINGAVISDKPLFTEAEEKKREEEYAKRVEYRAQWYEGNKAYREQQETLKKEEEKRELQKEAYENAKRRFNSLSPVKKLWLNVLGKGINNYGSYNSVETLDSLYTRKR